MLSLIGSMKILKEIEEADERQRYIIEGGKDDD